MDDRDELVERVAAALRPLPAVDDAAKARLLIAVAAERERDREDAARRATPGHRRRWAMRITGLAAAAALVVGVAVRTAQRPPAPARDVAASAVASSQPSPARLAGADAADPATAPRPVELVLRAPAATSVRVVGDFNGWDKALAPMQRDAASGLWSVTLSLRPGRHVYAFVVDDTLWMRDPRAPAAKDEDFGRPGSVLLVGRP